ncbi:MAG: hypothetical protein AB1486_08155 [Planctomycetota bacterium]
MTYSPRRGSIAGGPALIAALFLLLLCPCGCRYAAHRGRDLTDIVTLAAETSGANAAVQCGPIITGLGSARGQGFGLRAGAMGKYQFDEWNVLIASHRSFTPSEELGGKDYELDNHVLSVLVGAAIILAPLVLLMSCATGPQIGSYYGSPPPRAPGSSESTGRPTVASLVPERWPDLPRGHRTPPEGLAGAWLAWLQVEVTASAGLGARAGVNLGEFVDFILGWTTLDICSDDV